MLCSSCKHNQQVIYSASRARLCAECKVLVDMEVALVTLETADEIEDAIAVPQSTMVDMITHDSMFPPRQKCDCPCH